MRKIMLNGQWELAEAGNDRLCEVQVPGSVLSGLYGAGKIEDPFYRTNEDVTRELFRKDYEFSRTFVASEDILKEEKIILVCEGLDTLADIYINGQKAGSADNMHRTWKLDVKEFLHSGENQIRIVFRSVFKYIEAYEYEDNKEIHYVPCGGMKGNQLIRKAHCMFGWDWGPQTIDAGIFRDIYLEAYSHPRIEDVKITQVHGDNAVDVCTTVAVSGDAVDKCQVRVTIQEDAESVCGHRTGANDRKTEAHVCKVGETVSANNNPAVLTSSIHNPKLWWPNGYGKQPLYTLTIQLKAGETVLDTREYCIGLRTVTVSHEDDQWGQEFAIMVNGVKIFARGADYIPDDCFYPRITREILERDVKACVFANFNCLRVWGGGYYPSDEFYDLCDEYGILLWEDLMYACNIYDVTPDFAENIAIEAKDNILRFRNHACLGLICGNNELECAWTDWKDAQGHAPSLKRDYLYQFEFLLADVVKENAPDAFYWPSSPSSGGSFDNPCDENRGDCHYWDVWHGQKPFSEYMKHYFRFCSEFGFQSLPSIKTVETFTGEKDRNLFSRVMESHQKNPAANGKILYYLSETFRYPKDLESLIFLSQILQGYAMKEATEHWRRNRGRCMGSIYWQFNDNWPVASWSSMDYYGRYKALHYMAKGFCDNVAGSIEKKETHMGFWISNETLAPVTVKAKIAVKTLDFQVIEEQEVSKEVPALSAECLFEKEYKELIAGRDDSVFFVAEYEYEQNGQKVSKKEFETFVPVKYLELKDPAFKVTENADGSVSIQTDTFVPYCMLEGISADTIWNENVVAFTDKEAVTLVPVENQKISRDGVRIYDIYHTYH